MQEVKNKTYIRKKIVVVFSVCGSACIVVCAAFISDGIRE